MVSSNSMEMMSSSFLQRCSPIPSCNKRLVCSLSKRVSSCAMRREERSTVAALMTTITKFASAVGMEEKQQQQQEEEEDLKVRASVTVRQKAKEGMKEKMANQLDALSDKLGRHVILQLISTEIDPRTRKPKTTSTAMLRDWFEKKDVKADRVIYTAEFVSDSSFGEPGAVMVINRHHREFFIESIVVEGFACGPVNFPCSSWVQPSKDHHNRRVFFNNKPYLPSETPPGLRALRRSELKELRGDGNCERRLTDRVYDYDVYNDLGNPDKGVDYVRPVVGGEAMPYPRRCRTGRATSHTDTSTEVRVEPPNPMYVPRDEAFEEAKMDMLAAGALKALLHNLVPSLVASVVPETQEFTEFQNFDNLFKIGLQLKESMQDKFFKKLPLVGKIQNSEGLFKYDTPDILKKDKFAWLRDDEFGRQALAGINPVNIERLETFPPTSKLDPAIYGPPECAITEGHIAGQLSGMTIQQALEENKLYILDYHDAYLPFLDRINAQPGRKAYATRTIFFLTQLGTLKPIAIELTLPPMPAGCSRAKRVLNPPTDATNNWLWQLAKAHVCSNDAGIHQLVNHWLRTHACIEPFILAAHRHMSTMHPIMKLLKPHMRYTLEINALARQILINAGGVIESGFTAGSCCMDISSAAYRDHWRFDQEGLPADLVRRGMAIEDPTQPHGLKLLIKDYPYAADGLLLWFAIETWVRRYVDAYYPSYNLVQSDTELQSWYAEVINIGHADKRDANWWPRLASPDDLASILTTVIWLASAQHAALNFGQYPLGGYIPNRPPLMRRLLPVEGDPEYEHFREDPHAFFLSSMPSLMQATAFMTVIDTLSTHSTDEEYIGSDWGEAWTADTEAVEAFREFGKEVRKVEEEMERRNRDPALRNRCGAGVMPYELMMPSSPPGVTCRGVPNSASI